MAAFAALPALGLGLHLDPGGDVAAHVAALHRVFDHGPERLHHHAARLGRHVRDQGADVLFFHALDHGLTGADAASGDLVGEALKVVPARVLRVPGEAREIGRAQIAADLRIDRTLLHPLGRRRGKRRELALRRRIPGHEDGRVERDPVRQLAPEPAPIGQLAAIAAAVGRALAPVVNVGRLLHHQPPVSA
ncbi:hypothetical protein ACQ5SO_07525 [Rhodovulum sp. DZ06]|uniref:hypothetical protein n=1 Tax=Rhodovulum sp. DZ06 TaxID=3425126 RepID=UPI003D34E0F1